MDESSEYIPMPNQTLIARSRAALRTTLLQSLMRSPFIVKLRIFSQYPVEMPFVENKQMIQTFFPDCSYPPLSDGVGIRCPVRSLQDSQAFRLKYRIKDTGKFCVPIMNERSRLRGFPFALPDHLSCLLSHPDTGRMYRTGDLNNLSGI